MSTLCLKIALVDVQWSIAISKQNCEQCHCICKVLVHNAPNFTLRMVDYYNYPKYMLPITFFSIDDVSCLRSYQSINHTNLIDVALFFH